MDAATREAVRVRAQNRCEYCRIHQDADPFLTFHVEHIIPRLHGGTDDPNNLALACGYCNRRKGTNLTAFDPLTGDLTELFNPRKQRWMDCFEVVGSKVAGITSVGRATVVLLQMNELRRVQLRTL
jgi:hypothetical protein